MPNVVFRVPEGLLFGCMEFGWVVGCGSGWINWTHGQQGLPPRQLTKYPSVYG